MEASLERHDLESRRSNGGHGVPRRLATAECLRPEERVGGVLQCSKRGVPRADVLPEAELTTRFQHTSQFMERSGRVADTAEDAHQNSSVERTVRRRQLLRRAARQPRSGQRRPGHAPPTPRVPSDRARPRGDASRPEGSARTSARRRCRPRSRPRAGPQALAAVAPAPPDRDGAARAARGTGRTATASVRRAAAPSPRTLGGQVRRGRRLHPAALPRRSAFAATRRSRRRQLRPRGWRRRPSPTPCW